MTDPTPTYRPGDVVNGWRLTEGYTWEPAVPPAAPPAGVITGVPTWTDSAPQGSMTPIHERTPYGSQQGHDSWRPAPAGLAVNPYAGGAAVTNTPATVGLTFGIIAVLANILFLPSVVAVAAGIVGVSRAGRLRPSRGRARSVWAIVLGVIGIIPGVFWLSLLVGGVELPTGGAGVQSGAGERTTDAGGSSAAAGGSADLSEFAALDAVGWAQIAKDPDAAAGQKIVVHAEVTQFDAATGPDSFRANVGAHQPAAQYELETNTVLVGDSTLLADVVQGDVLRVHAVVDGSVDYETQIGGSTVAPQLKVVSVEKVGFADLTGDVTVGTAKVSEYGTAIVPLTITSSAPGRASYIVELTAVSSDGSTQLGTASAYADRLEPGQSVTVDAEFFPELPADAVISVVSVDRYTE